EYDDDNDIEIPKPRKILDPELLYSNDIDNEKDYETDLEDDEKKNKQPNTPKDIYINMCENLKVIPCRYFMAHIENKKLVMRYHQFSNEEVRAISKPLWHNFNVEKLYLDGNWIEFSGAKYLSRMVRQNDFITELSLADNRLGETTQGTQEVCRMVSENCILKKLNMSGNCFSDRDIEILTIALEKNRLLKELDLSHNNFGEESGKFLGQFISSNDTLEVLDLSWNNFRGKAAKEIALGIKENVRLKRCNVSFNGFDTDGGKVLADVIKSNNTLEHLSISNTRLTAECAAAIANAYEQNDSLRSLNMSNNPITTSGALAIIYSIKLNSFSILELLELSEIPVTKDFESVLKEIQEIRPDFKCLRGPVISTSNTKSILYEGGTKVDFEKILSSLKNK
ncbi:leucine-rich repeat-containing 74B-like, partial [Brachionus plicatilis]